MSFVGLCGALSFQYLFLNYIFEPFYYGCRYFFASAQSEAVNTDNELRARYRFL